MELEQKSESIKTVDELLDQYQSLLEKDEIGSLAEEDARMKVLSLKSIKKDIEEFA